MNKSRGKYIYNFLIRVDRFYLVFFILKVENILIDRNLNLSP